MAATKVRPVPAGFRKKCQQCGARFYRKAAHTEASWQRKRYCSNRCVARALRARRMGGIPRANKFAPRGRQDFFGTPPLPEPTAAAPGSAAKLAEMEARAARGLGLFHPRDADMSGGQSWDWRAAQAEEAKERAEADELRAARLWAVWGGRRAVASHPWDAPARAQ